MIQIPYSLVIEATAEPDYFCFFSPELGGFSGVGTSVQDCINQAVVAMPEHVAVLREFGKAVPPANPNPHVLIINAGSPVPDEARLPLSA